MKSQTLSPTELSSSQLNQKEEKESKPEEGKQVQMDSYTEGSQILNYPIFTSQQFENLWKFIYLGVSILSAVLMKKIYLFQTLPDFDNVREGTFLDLVIISLPFAAIFTGFDLLVHYIFDDFCLKYYLTEQRYDGEARKKRAYTLVKWGYSLAYYGVSSIWAYFLIKDTVYFPTWLGGEGACSNVFLGTPKINGVTYGMKIFYLLQFGKHLSRLISHAFIRPQGNYYQYALHHALSSFLIFFSFLTNMWLVGTMVLLCHDFSDFFLISARSYKDCKYCSQKILKVFYLIGFFAWVFCRLVVFPACCVLPVLTTVSSVAHKSLDELGLFVMEIPIYSMGVMLAILEVLQIFWTYYIIQSFLSVNVTKKVQHNYD